jgi:beta-lactamase superfamily II metal-dependent hydrolase
MAGAFALGLLGLVLGATTPNAQAAVPDAPHCSTSGTWKQGELNVYWFDVEQGDSQLIVGPTGRTMLIDLGESAFNTTGANTHATRVASAIRAICGIGAGPVHLDYVVASHHHLDHIGYSHVPGDTAAYGQGLYQLLTPPTSGGLGFTVGQVVDHDGGRWADTNANGACEPGTSTLPSDEIIYDNAGTTSATAARFICWLYGPTGQADRANIDGKILQLTNTAAWPSFDLGDGVTTTVLEANAKDVKEADGTTPVSGDHHAEATPPSENDYSIGLRIAFGPYTYVTAGDSDGEYATSANAYTYNDVESLVASRAGTVNTIRANHHGSGHSSSNAYVNATNAQNTVISCGVNSFGHPANRTLDAYRAISADIFLLNKPCDDLDTSGAAIDYTGTLNSNGDIHLATAGGGASFDVTYDTGTKHYTTRTATPPPGDPTAIRVNEYLMAPTAPGTEWVELYNPTGSAIPVGGLFIDDLAAGGGAPKAIPAGTSIPAGGRWVMDIPSGFLNNTGTDQVRFLAIVGGVETVYDTTSYTLGSTQTDKVFHRTGDGGSWCATISLNLTKGAANPATCP